MVNKALNKLGIVCLFTLALISLCSCTDINKRINYFVPGFFSGYNEYDNTQLCYLNITEITEESFQNSNGRNVINDLVSNKFYSIEFYVTDNDSNKIVIDFSYLEDAFDGATGTRISYKDQNNNWITPFTTDERDYRDDNDKAESYSIHITDKDFEVFSYLYLMEESTQ